MLLSAALIVRDESLVLEECLVSVRDVVDEIVIVDTGSVDDTREIARRHRARVIDHEWRDDFALARNLALDAAQGDWILYIDADERLHHRGRADVERMLAGAREVAFRLLLRPDSRSTPYREYRLWRQDPRIRFVGQIHEKVTPAISAIATIDRRPISDCDLLLEHVGYDGDQTHKHRRNLPLLRAELDRDPDNLFNRHHLARVLQGLGQAEEAETVLTDAVAAARAQPGNPLGVLLFTDLVRMRRERGEDIGALLTEARRRYPSNKLLWWVQASVWQAEHRYEEALALFDRLLLIDLSVIPAHEPAYDERIFGELAHEGRGACLFRLGRYAEATAAFESAAALDPENLAYRSKAVAARGRVPRG